MRTWLAILFALVSTTALAQEFGPGEFYNVYTETNMCFEGPVPDANKLCQLATNPTAARTITWRDASGTPVISGDTLGGQVSATFETDGSTSVTVLTANALAANGGNCSAGSYPLGVDTLGAAESCTVAFNQTIEDEGTPRAQRTNTNFTGAGVSAVDSGGKTVVTIPGVVAEVHACVTLPGPDNTDIYYLGHLHPTANLTITDIRAWTPPSSGSTVIVTVQKRDSANASPAGLDGASTITADDNGQDDDGTLSAGGMTAGQTWSVLIGTVTGSPVSVTVCIDGTIP